MIIRKTDIAQSVAQKTNLSKTASEAAVNAVLEAISEALVAGNKVQLFNFGTFEVKNRPEREAHNIRNNKTVTVPARNVLKFKASASWKNKL